MLYSIYGPTYSIWAVQKITDRKLMAEATTQQTLLQTSFVQSTWHLSHFLMEAQV